MDSAVISVRRIEMSISIHHGERAALDNMLYRSENELTEIVRQKFTKASQSKTHPTKSINVKSTSNVLHFLHDTSPCEKRSETVSMMPCHL